MTNVLVLVLFTNIQSWQCWHNCHILAVFDFIYIDVSNCAKKNSSTRGLHLNVTCFIGYVDF